MIRSYSLIDEILCHIDAGLKTLLPPNKRSSARSRPISLQQSPKLSDKQSQHIAGLMRVNHCGEVCAQALYTGQAITAQLPHIKAQMQQAALEEIDHLAWCEERLTELNSKTSILNPLWYSLSWLLGASTGLVGDGISLGFVAETERQVTLHLQNHIEQVKNLDHKTYAILLEMQKDEQRHAINAETAGAQPLPFVVQLLMKTTSNIMTSLSYYI